MLPARTGLATDISWSAPMDTELVRTFAANEHCFYNLYVCRELEREGFD
jgi:hypothetical protein